MTGWFNLSLEKRFVKYSDWHEYKWTGWGSHSVGRELAQSVKKPWFHPAPQKAGVVHICNPTIGRWRQESEEFKIILNYIASLRSAWVM